MSDIRSCKTCGFSFLDLTGAGGRRCRVNPPVPLGVPMTTAQGISLQIVSVWPGVKDDERCGSWERDSSITMNAH